MQVYLYNVYEMKNPQCKISKKFEQIVKILNEIGYKATILDKILQITSKKCLNC